MATRAEIEAKHANRGADRCAGPLRLSQERRDRATRRHDDVLAGDDRDVATAAMGDLVQVLDEALVIYHGTAVVLPDGDRVATYVAADDDTNTVLVLNPRIALEQLATMATYLIRARTYCGEDLSAAIAALPFDGRNHAVACAKCGNTTIVDRPLPDEDRQAVTDAKLAALDAHLEDVGP